ncbi:hypothetical protein [uncultured Brevibacterium sp.]|uniref:hypothetical protein n=1 Tax=uncultured Brevibacterium sp. TaxID=189678 RepID=UPI0025F29F59|nr:hypothetical protein [uncultured Brevibacterium sp.]
MTIVAAWEHWTKRTADAEDAASPKVGQLVFASDSRFSGGGSIWDANAKIFNIGRDDCLVAFTGETDRALPLIFQAISAASSYEGSRLRTLDVPAFSDHFTKVLNSVLSELRDETVGARGDGDPGCKFLLGGWSWALSRFVIYRIFFDKRLGEFTKGKVKKKPGALADISQVGAMDFIGDKEAESEFRSILPQVVKQYSDKPVVDCDRKEGLSLPLEAVYRQTQSSSHTVGGPVQVSIVSQRIHAEHLAVDVDGQLTINGRRRLKGERMNVRRVRREGFADWRIYNSVP